MSQLNNTIEIRNKNSCPFKAFKDIFIVGCRALQRLHSYGSYLDQSRVSYFVVLLSPVPGSRILPVQIQTVEFVLPQEAHGAADEPLAAGTGFDHLGEPGSSHSMVQIGLVMEITRELHNGKLVTVSGCFRKERPTNTVTWFSTISDIIKAPELVYHVWVRPRGNRLFDS